MHIQYYVQPELPMNSLNVAYNCIYEVYHLHLRFHVIVQVLYCIQTYYAYTDRMYILH